MLRLQGARVALLISAALWLGACGSPGTGLNADSSSSPVNATVSPGCTPATGLKTPYPSATPTPGEAPTPIAAGHLPPARQIRIALSVQHLWAYEGSAIVVSTDVTTGMPALPTPTGHFHVIAKYSPYYFVSPWPRGSPYFYESVWVDYAILFADGGYFIHDAAWQQNFGPGGNLKTGSHGCVNVPPRAMPALYEWARGGDDVIVTN
jgi:L,D-transpeptidase-like protein